MGLQVELLDMALVTTWKKLEEHAGCAKAFPTRYLYSLHGVFQLKQGGIMKHISSRETRSHPPSYDVSTCSIRGAKSLASHVLVGSVGQARFCAKIPPRKLQKGSYNL